MSKRHFLDFEQPIAELETKIEELRYVQNESAVDIDVLHRRFDETGATQARSYRLRAVPQLQHARACLEKERTE